MTLPRISIVTAVYNGEIHLEETISSILDQGYPNLEYIIVDDGSTDRTPEIIRKYEQHLAWWTSQPNQGMYASLNTGFSKSTGEILGWLNDSDKLHPGGLSVVGSVFRDLPQVEWITGRPTLLNEEGLTTYVGPVPRWSHVRFLAGFNRYIQQESTFWRRGLWEKAGGYVDDSGRCGHVADFELWVRFFRLAKLYPVDALIGGFRMDRNSRGLKNLDLCHQIHDRILDEELQRFRYGPLLKAFRSFKMAIKKIPVVRFGWWQLIERPLSTWPGPDRPPIIRSDSGRWHLS